MLITPAEAPRDRLIVALDVETAREALSLVDELEGVVSFYKVGYQLFLAEGLDFVRELARRGKRVFLDLKMDDVGETITKAVEVIAKNDVCLLTLQGSGATVRAALVGRGGAEFPKLLSVSLLSSMDDRDLIDLQILGEKGKFKTLPDYVMWRATQAVDAGADGVIASGETVGALRQKLGNGSIIVTPGIRPAGVSTDDHKRFATPKNAIAAGADYLVVGRPIRNTPDRRGMAERIIDEIERASLAGA